MIYDYENIVVGCGNILFKDDGFGPTVINTMIKNNVDIPKNTKVIDGSTGSVQHIFSLPSPKWKKIILVDVVDFNSAPGTIKTFKIDQIQKEDKNILSIEDINPINMLYHLKDKYDITIVACQPKLITTPEINIGLTKPVKKSIPYVIKCIQKILN
ncbi:MAG: coenzyme F420-reducing hydrogenase, FrhD protein [Methanobacteriaceae archaeon]|nr:coenzyme F420-reducing hydrogenase, FrhD protein [Methanobacteriaceae archaeon]